MTAEQTRTGAESFIGFVAERSLFDARYASEAWQWSEAFLATLTDEERGDLRRGGLRERFVRWCHARRDHGLVPLPRYSHDAGAGSEPERWWDRYIVPFIESEAEAP